MLGDDSLTWEQIREGAADGMAPIEIDPQTGLPVPTVAVSSSPPASRPVWPWLLGAGVLLLLLSRK